MKIRAVTSFLDPTQDVSSSLKILSTCSAEITSALVSTGYTVQSQRIATTPFPNWLSGTPRKDWSTAIRQLVEQTTSLGWQYTSIGPALPEHTEDYNLIPEFLSLDENLFAGGIISNGIHLYPKVVEACAKVIVENSTADKAGFTNLRFAALANVKTLCPFPAGSLCQPR